MTTRLLNSSWDSSIVTRVSSGNASILVRYTGERLVLSAAISSLDSKQKRNCTQIPVYAADRLVSRVGRALPSSPLPQVIGTSTAIVRKYAIVRR